MIAAHISGGALPVPDDAALAVSERLKRMIGRAIAERDGEFGFDDYMQRALFEPMLGYYSGGACKFGGAGDFVTAPELSPVFSHCLARQCRQVLSHLGGGAILELGPGTGAMAVDMLLWLERHDALPDVYYLLEPSATLRERQRLKFADDAPHLAGRVIWCEGLPEKKLCGMIIANEVLDVLPVKRVVVDDGLYEQTVTCDDAGRFGWRIGRLGESVASIAARRIDGAGHSLPQPYITEINPVINSWLKALDAVLERGVILFADYGYPRRDYLHPERRQGTLVCHYRHYMHDDPFLYPGLQDISAAVDFSSVAEAAVELGLHVAGFATQAHFLIACGLDEVIAEQARHGSASRERTAGAVNTLTMPGEMGEQFKFIGMTKSLDIALMGFSFVNLKGRL